MEKEGVGGEGGGRSEPERMSVREKCVTWVNPNQSPQPHLIDQPNGVWEGWPGKEGIKMRKGFSAILEVRLGKRFTGVDWG